MGGSHKEANNFFVPKCTQIEEGRTINVCDALVDHVVSSMINTLVG